VKSVEVNFEEKVATVEMRAHVWLLQADVENAFNGTRFSVREFRQVTGKRGPQ